MKMNQYKTIFSLILICTTTCFGQDQKHDEEIVVTANRYETALSDVGSSTVVITAEEIKDMQVPTVADALKLINGIQIIQSGGPGKTTGLLIRGAHSRHTLVLIDGIRMNENTAGGANLSEIPIDQIDRIEIIKGSQSSLYGSDAIAGVVQIITKRKTDEGLEGQFKLQMGTSDHRRGSININGKKQRVDYGFSISRYEIGGYSIAPGDEEDPFSSVNYNSTVGIQLPDEGGRLDFQIRFSENQTDLDGGWGLPAEDLDRSQNSQMTASSLSWKHVFSTRILHQLSLSYLSQETNGVDDGETSYLYENQNTRLDYQITFEPSTSLSIVSGFAYENQNGSNQGNFEDQAVVSQAIFGETIWNITDDILITLGLRNDDHEFFGNETTYRFSGNLKATQSTTLHGSYGTGFKAPTLNDLFWPESPWSAGNPDLSPETSVSYDIGVTFNTGVRFSTDITWFSSEIDELIVWMPDENYVWKPTNLHSVELQGVEINFASQLTNHLHATIHGTYLESEDGVTGAQLDYRPKHQVGLSLAYSLPKNSNLRLDAQHTGERFETTIDGTVPLKAYTKLDFSLMFPFRKAVSFSLHINNLTDEVYQEYTGFGIPGRYAFIGAGYHF